MFLNFKADPSRVAPRGGRWNARFKLAPIDKFDGGETVLGPYGAIILKRDTSDLKRTLEEARMRTS